MKFRYIFVAATVITAFALSGCGGIGTADELFCLMREELKNVKSYDADVELRLDMDYTAGGVKDNFKLAFDESLSAIMGSNEASIDGSMKIEDIYSDEWKSFIVEKDGQYKSYTNSEGEWYYSYVNEKTLEAGPSHIFDLIMGEKDYTFKNGSSYVVSMDADSEYLIKILESLYSNILQDAFSGGLDTSGLKGNVSVEIDKKSLRPKKLKIVFGDCADMFISEELFQSADIKTFEYNVDFTEYDRIEDIDIPESVEDLFNNDDEDETNLETAKAPETETQDGAENEEKTYELADYGGENKITLKAPEGYVYNQDSDVSLMYFDRMDNTEDKVCSVSYEYRQLNDSFTKADIEDFISDKFNFYSGDSDYKDFGFFEKKQTQVGDYTVNYEGLKYYYAGDEFQKASYQIEYKYWAYVDDYAISCEAINIAKDDFGDFDAEQMAKVLFEAIAVQ